MMKIVHESQLKAQFSSLFDKVIETHETIIIERDGGARITMLRAQDLAKIQEELQRLTSSELYLPSQNS